jgi:hypothetical protein
MYTFILLYFYTLARECEYKPPEEWMDQTLDWPLESLKMGSVASYECPIFKATEDYLHMQYSQCIFDEETDEMIWWPPNVLPCNREFKL